MLQVVKISIGGGPTYILGQVEFKVVEGEISVNGRNFYTESVWTPIFSPRSNALLALESTTSSIVELRPLDNGLLGIQNCQTGFANLFSPESDIVDHFDQVVPGCFVLKGNESTIPLMRIGEEWKSVISDLNGSSRSPVVFVCGHRKVGKSSFSRFLLNGLLNDYPEVDLVDLDLGQTEFTTAGFVARKRFTSKDSLLGPPFTHLSVPDDAIYLASSNGSESPFLYCQALQTLNSRCIDEAKPIVINTMGWMTGLGLEFIIFALQLFRPTHIVAFMSPESDGESDLVRKCLLSKSTLIESKCFTDDEITSINVRYMGNPVSEGPRVKHTPSDLRNLAFWAYFFGQHSSTNISRFNFDNSLSSLRPLVVPLSQVQLACTSREVNLFDLLQPRAISEQIRLLESWMMLRLVGLASDSGFKQRTTTIAASRWVNLLGKTGKITRMPCKGVGIIRSIVRVDGSSKIHLHILTSLPLELIVSEGINTLIFGSQQVPHQLFSADTLSVQAESPGFSTQSVLGAEVNGAGARKTRHNMRRN